MPLRPAPERLGGVLDNARFPILPWVQVKNLASKVLAMAAALAALDLDETVTATEADTAPFVAQLQALADEAYRLTAHVTGVESDNERSGRAQAALSRIAGEMKRTLA